MALREAIILRGVVRGHVVLLAERLHRQSSLLGPLLPLGQVVVAEHQESLLVLVEEDPLLLLLGRRLRRGSRLLPLRGFVVAGSMLRRFRTVGEARHGPTDIPKQKFDGFRRIMENYTVHRDS